MVSLDSEYADADQIEAPRLCNDEGGDQRAPLLPAQEVATDQALGGPLSDSDIDYALEGAPRAGPDLLLQPLAAQRQRAKGESVTAGAWSP